MCQQLAAIGVVAVELMPVDVVLSKDQEKQSKQWRRPLSRAAVDWTRASACLPATGRFASGTSRMADAASAGPWPARAEVALAVAVVKHKPAGVSIDG